MIVVCGCVFTDVTISTDKSVDELEEELAEAERTALEAQQRARELREMIQTLRPQNCISPN